MNHRSLQKKSKLSRLPHTPTVTVAVCAHNEAQNIGDFLRSVLRQQEDGFVLRDILVISDGSTDSTVREVKKIRSKKIHVIDYPKRIGKSSHLNTLYRSLTSDILVQSDADVTFANQKVIKNIIKPLKDSQTIAMCGGHPTPLKAKTFTESAVNCTCEVFLALRQRVRGGNNVLSADGRLLAFRRELVKQITVPADMIANDAFAYFCCKYIGYGYCYVKSAVVNFRSPQTLRDQIRQNTRFNAASLRMKKYFPKSLVKQEYQIPAGLVLPLMLKQFTLHPIKCTYVFIVNRYCQYKARCVERKLSALWQIAQTTKHL